MTSEVTTDGMNMTSRSTRLPSRLDVWRSDLDCAHLASRMVPAWNDTVSICVVDPPFGSQMRSSRRGSEHEARVAEVIRKMCHTHTGPLIGRLSLAQRGKFRRQSGTCSLLEAEKRRRSEYLALLYVPTKSRSLTCHPRFCLRHAPRVLPVRVGTTKEYGNPCGTTLYDSHFRECCWMARWCCAYCVSAF